MKNDKKLKIPHPKFKKTKKKILLLESKIPSSLIEAMNNSYETQTLKLKNRTTKELSINNLLDLPSIFIANAKLKSKSSLMNDLSDIKYINKSIYHQLGKILNEEERIINTHYYKTNNFNFDFEAFEQNKSTKNNLFKSKSYCNYEDISYLNRYEEIIKDKMSNERKAEQYINEMNDKLKKKLLIENDIMKEIINFEKEKDENKIKLSTEIDAKTAILKDIHSKVKRSSSSPNCSIRLLNEKEKKENILKQKAQILTKEIDDLKKKQKKIEENNQNLMTEYLQKSKHLHDEIKKLKIELNEHIKSGIEYYLEILKKGTDTRSEGLSWVVRKLLKLGYKPQLNNFPNYFDNHMIKYLIEYSKKKNENCDLVEQLHEYKNNIIKNNVNNSNTNKKESKHSLKHSTEKYIERKIGELLDKHKHHIIISKKENHFENFKKNHMIIFPSIRKINFNQIEDNKDNNKNNKKEFLKNLFKDRLNEFEKIVEIRKRYELNLSLLKKLKDDEYKYVIDKKSKSHSFDRDNRENIIKSLFGIKKL